MPGLDKSAIGHVSQAWRPKSSSFMQFFELGDDVEIGRYPNEGGNGEGLSQQRQDIHPDPCDTPGEQSGL